MSLEQALKENTQALQALTQALAANQNDGVPAFVRNAAVDAGPVVGKAHTPVEELTGEVSADAMPDTVEEPESAGPKKRGPKPKAKTETPAVDTPKPAQKAAAKSSKGEQTVYEQLVEKVLALAEKDQDKLVVILASFGVTRASQLKPEQHEEALNAVSSAFEEVADQFPTFV